jgi:hypothetical protein
MNNLTKKNMCNPPQLQVGVILLAVKKLKEISINIIATMVNIHKPPLKKATVSKSVLKTTNKNKLYPRVSVFGG